MQNFFLSLIILLYCSTLNATTFHVGADKPYTTPNALYLADVLNDSDTIEIDGETYIGEATLAVWQQNDLLIRGVGGRPHLVADGAYIWGKGIWVLGGNNITVENIEFSGATVPDQNGAGIRLDGIGLTVRSCYFHDNENGILTSNPYDGDILVEYSEFSGNGFGAGFSHNIYVGHVNSFTFQYNYNHHAYIGHCVKSRANENYILYNRIMDEEDGVSSRLIDLPNGGFSVVMGNVLMQGPMAENSQLIGYGLEGLTNSDPHEIHIMYNSIVNKRQPGGSFIGYAGGLDGVLVSNNIFAGTTNAELFPLNIREENIDAIGFSDELNFDYTLTENSPTIDVGSTTTYEPNGFSLIPDKMYVHPTGSTSREIVGDQIDMGAFEFGEITSTSTTLNSEIKISPNPFSECILVEGNFSNATIQVFDGLGQLIASQTRAAAPLLLELAELDAGFYFIRIEDLNKLVSVCKIIKP